MPRSYITNDSNKYTFPTKAHCYCWYETKFKTRFADRNSVFKHQNKAASKERYWSFKERDIQSNITWNQSTDVEKENVVTLYVLQKRP